MFSLFGQIVFAWILADLFTGVFHWAMDRYFRTEWPIIGEFVAAPNELHHSHPQAFLEGDYFTRNWTTILPAALGFYLTLLLSGPGWLLFFWLFVSQSNEIHAWAHRKGKLPRIIELVQETGILQSVKHHSVHHRSPHLANYCILSNWSNPWLDRYRAWDRFEAALAKVGITPKE